MAIATQVTCDVCGKQKGDVNCWWVGTITEVGTHKSLKIYPWPTGSKEVANGKTVNHLCGQECVIKAVSEWMAKASGGK
jgi:hypothetical protein